MAANFNPGLTPRFNQKKKNAGTKNNGMILIAHAKARNVALSNKFSSTQK
jgi:hypothetical protein